MIELRSPTTLVTLDDDGMTCPGVMVQDVWDVKSRGTVVSVTGGGYHRPLVEEAHHTRQTTVHGQSQ